MNIKKVNWGIIGCGEVTEMKSGPAFNKVPDSALVAVMRRDAAKAKDYAKRHNVPRWYNDATELINDPEVNAVYIATPPSLHKEYSIAAMSAGKPVYVEKPMALNYAEAKDIAEIASAKNIKMVVAHYRRQQPFFKKIKEWLDEKIIGEVRLANLMYYRHPFNEEELLIERNSWRVDPVIAGGGIFHDLAPHQLDLMLYFFGAVEKVSGIAANQAGNYKADDIVAGNILFKNGIAFNGSWCFSSSYYTDQCEIIGSLGKICFNVFDNRLIRLTVKDKMTEIIFEPLQHVQQPIIAQTVQYFLGKVENPGSPWNGAEVMRLMDEMVKR